jgi:hypothetical protein
MLDGEINEGDNIKVGISKGEVTVSIEKKK